LTFADFFEKHFIPHVTAKRKPSTVKFYKDAFKNHLERTVGVIRLRDFTTAHAQSLLDGIDLSHQSLLRIKTVMSAAFTIARQKDFIRTANPIVGTKAEGSRSTFNAGSGSVSENVALIRLSVSGPTLLKILDDTVLDQSFDEYAHHRGR
jgi:hypothetical protein